MEIVTLHPPFHIGDYPTLLHLLGADEFARIVCPLNTAREQYRGYEQAKRQGYVAIEALVLVSLAKRNGWQVDT